MYKSLVLFVCLFYFSLSKDLLPRSDTPAETVIHATNYSSVPSVHHIVDAVELLKEAYSVYTDPLERAKLYAELYQEKHNETQWNVVVGYSAAFLKSQWYVETSVTEGSKKNKDFKDSKKDDKNKEVLYLIFSTV